MFVVRGNINYTYALHVCVKNVIKQNSRIKVQMFHQINPHFYVWSDPQIGNTKQEYCNKVKLHKLTKLAANIKQNKAILLIPGDLTENGENGTWLNCMWKKVKSCFGDSTCSKELDQFVKEVYNPLMLLFDNRVYLCHGNHDTVAFPQTPVLDFVKQKHGGLNYCTKLNDHVVLITLGKCYTQGKREMLLKWLDKYAGHKFIIMQHYFYYHPGGTSFDWWEQDDKDDFIRTLTPYKDHILFIAEGHTHISHRYNKDGFLFVNGAGETPELVDLPL